MQAQLTRVSPRGWLKSPSPTTSVFCHIVDPTRLIPHRCILPSRDPFIALLRNDFRLIFTKNATRISNAAISIAIQVARRLILGEVESVGDFLMAQSESGKALRVFEGLPDWDVQIAGSLGSS